MVLLSCLWFVWFKWHIFILSSSEGTMACSLLLRAWIRTYIYQTNKQTKVSHITVTGRSWDQIQVQLRSQCLRDKGWWEKTDAFIQEVGNLERWMSVTQTISQLPVRWKSILQGKTGNFQGCAGRSYMQNSTVSSDQHLKTGHTVTWSVSSVIYSSRIDLFTFPWGPFLTLDKL